MQHERDIEQTPLPPAEQITIGMWSVHGLSGQIRRVEEVVKVGEVATEQPRAKVFARLWARLNSKEGS